MTNRTDIKKKKKKKNFSPEGRTRVASAASILQHFPTTAAAVAMSLPLKKKKKKRTDIICEFPGTSPRVQLAPALPVPFASSLSLSLFLGGPAGSGFAPEKAKTGVQFKIRQALAPV